MRKLPISSSFLTETTCSSEIIEFYSDRVIVNTLVQTGAFAQGDKVTMCIVVATQYFRSKIGSLTKDGCFQKRMRARLFFVVLLSLFCINDDCFRLSDFDTFNNTPA